MTAVPLPARRVLVAALVLTAMVGVGSVPNEQVGAQPAPGTGTDRPAELVDVASVSPWVEPDGDFEVRFGPSPAVPDGALLTVTIHESIDPRRGSVRDELLEVLDGAAPGRILQAPITVPFADLSNGGDDPAFRLPIRARSANSERILLPNPGVHPVELVLTGPDGPELWRHLVFLNRLPTVREGDVSLVSSDPLPVNLFLPLDSEPPFRPSGSVDIDLDDRSRLSAGGELLRAVPEAPLWIAARPNTLDGLEALQAPWAERVLDSLRTEALAGRALLMPYAQIDTAGVLATGRRDVFDRQLLVGADRTIGQFGDEPARGVWALDRTLSDTSLPVLSSLGIDTLFVHRSDLAIGPEPSTDDAVTEPFRVAAGEPIRALAFDEEVSARLNDPGADPAIRAHEATTLLMSNWFDGVRLGRQGLRAAAVVIQPGTDPESLRELTAALTTSGPLRPGLQQPLPDTPAGELPVIPLAPRSVPDQGPVVDAVVATSQRLTAWSSITSDADPQLGRWEQLNDQSLSSQLEPSERAELHSTIDAELQGSIASIELPRARRVILTSEDTTIPLRFRNALDIEVRLELRARSPRLELGDDGVIEIALLPGENRVDLPVNVRAPGETLLRLQVNSPDGQLVVGSVDVPVRSTAISGVGAALSVISLSFLIVWWLLTHRRHRRASARRLGNHPTSPGPPDDEADEVRLEPDSRTVGDTTDATGAVRAGPGTRGQ